MEARAKIIEFSIQYESVTVVFADFPRKIDDFNRKTGPPEQWHCLRYNQSHVCLCIGHGMR